MKITRSQLKLIIKEELGKVLKEAETEAEFARHQGGLYGGSKRPVDVSGGTIRSLSDEDKASLSALKNKVVAAVEEDVGDWFYDDPNLNDALDDLNPNIADSKEGFIEDLKAWVESGTGGDPDEYVPQEITRSIK